MIPNLKGLGYEYEERLRLPSLVYQVCLFRQSFKTGTTTTNTVTDKAEPLFYIPYIQYHNIML